MKDNIIFIISLPRSGSTLLQKILASHPSIESHSEPWLLLPLISIFFNKNNMVSTFSMQNWFTANEINNLKINSKNMRELDSLISNFVGSYYSKMSKKDGASYFLDKTPRYYSIIPEIIRIFPDAKFIFLLRNPLDVAISSHKLFGANSLRYFPINADLNDGPTLLARSLIKYRDNKNIHITYYESLVNNPVDEVNKILKFVKVNSSKKILNNILNNFSETKLFGKLGDPLNIGINTIVKNKKDLNIQFINSKLRKWYFIKYIKNIDQDFFNYTNYSRKEILNSLYSLRVAKIFSFIDLKNLFISFIVLKINLNLFKKKFKLLRNRLLN